MSISVTRRTALGAGIVAIAVASAAGLASSALFTSTDTSVSSYAAGTVVLNSGGGASVFTVTNVQGAPGTTSYGKVTVANQGSLGLRYAMTSVSTNVDTKSLAGRLQLTVVPVAASAVCDAAAISGGSAIYSGALSAAFFGSNAAGATAGDRSLAASSTEALCMQVSFTKGTALLDNPFQGATTSTTFTFDAEQTLNNA